MGYTELMRGLDVSTRLREPELMDDPALDEHLHHKALDELAFLNALSGSARNLWPPIEALAREAAPRPLRVLDLATGGGDVPVRLWRRARRSGVALEIAGCDRSPAALALAGERTRRAGARIRWFPWDAFRQGVPGDYDVLICSLFLHHLEPEEVVRLLKQMAGAAERAVLVQDIRRSAVGLALACAGAHLTTSPIIRVDWPRSVRAAFTVAEIRRMADDAGLRGAEVLRRWPLRCVLIWRKT